MSKTCQFLTGGLKKMKTAITLLNEVENRVNLKKKKTISSLIFIKVTKIAVLLIKILRFLLTYNFDL